jgi:hypothetical protein
MNLVCLDASSAGVGRGGGNQVSDMLIKYEHMKRNPNPLGVRTSVLCEVSSIIFRHV